MTPITNRPIPDGYQLEWDNTIWNVGYVFRWSNVYDDYLRCNRITVKPGESLAVAFQREVNEPLTLDLNREVFFLK